ncbi:unnamed protein product [Anisakis simplex]|uniref:F-box domain-containing protein n=1 Tax=Anisakis simplex TaxID=6269 RepID=A0A0M3KJG5_ANISI|nr:unnamed protein product [Anisakis simplex]
MTIGNCQLASSFRPLCKSALRSVRRFLTNGTVQLRNRLCKSSRNHRITALPNDLQLNILSYLPPEDVLSAKLVCRQWNALINRYPTSTHRFPIEITIKNPANGNCEIWVEVKQTTSNCFTVHQLFPQKFQVTFEKLDSWSDLLQHCIVESIVLDGSNRSKKAKFKPNAANQLDDYIIERICNLLRRLNASKRLCELQTFTMCNWTIAEVRTKRSQVTEQSPYSDHSTHSILFG